MKYVKEFKNFVSEKFTPTQNDHPEQVSSMNNFNDMEKWIKEFNSMKTVVQNVYDNYKTEDELTNTLFGKKLINSKNLKQMKFNNPLLGMWAKACESKRRLNDLTSKTDKNKQDLVDDQTNVKNNPSMAQSFEDTIKQKQQNISDNQSEINDLKLKVANLEKQTRDELKKMTDRMNLSKKQIRMDTSEKE